MAGSESLEDILKAIRAYFVSEQFNEYADAAAMQMVTHLFRDSGRTWRQAARENSKGRIIYEALQKEMQGPVGSQVRLLTKRNAEYIKSMPLHLAQEVNKKVLEESLKGTRASDIAEMIRKDFPHMTWVKANLIARTETSKTSTALTEARSEYIGAAWYVWNSSEDQRVRESHANMDGVLVRWSDPPSPEALVGERNYGTYPAGGTFNCRCFPSVLLDLDDVQWPARVFYGGSVQRMTRKQFERIM
ncbi:phage putative head morphogenesis protein, SPP1 gp7 family [Paenibacillus algorifonticola]|uniref:Phage putative head morphogenesis protein, SPP1 gp7 family n=1 Tax=Paenibacillus algorifonticola TaxID=684063 RepID=A0A1I2AIY8_9BACL|nr:phage putative head morphogenesis protein, SPP1 gp7 family [Paenibacillus algorifonticola]